MKDRLRSEGVLPRRDWVQCPICHEDDMRCDIDAEGYSLIFCTNHGCPSNLPDYAPDVVRTDGPIAYLRDIDGTGSLHACAAGDPGAIPVYA